MITKLSHSVRYIVDEDNKKTDVIVPLDAWEKLLLGWKRLEELLEDQEDMRLLQEWLEKEAAGEAETISLEELEQELLADGLL